MRFSEAWSQVYSQNVVLRVTLTSMAVVGLGLTILCAKLALKDPLVIERSCATTVAQLASAPPTDGEVEMFLREALGQRFNSSANLATDYFSIEELRARENEQTELSRREIKQTIIINLVTRTGDNLTVDADRILSVGAIRSAFQFPLTVNVAKVTRSSTNPYGLIVKKITQQEVKEGE